VEGTTAGLERKIEGAEGKVPDQLQGLLAQLEGRLSELAGRLGALEDRTAAALEDPSQANVERLDAALAALEPRVEDLLGREVVQSPGELLVVDSDQLEGVQGLVQALRNLGLVLPVVVLLLYLGAIYLARGWRRQALIAAGGGILAATLLALLARRLIGSAVVNSLAGSQTVEPAIRSVWETVSDACASGRCSSSSSEWRSSAAAWLQGPVAARSPCDASSLRTCATTRSPSTRSSPGCSSSGWPSSRGSKTSGRSW
jgi:hypothetical protein